jgi:hypothetical protein
VEIELRWFQTLQALSSGGEWGVAHDASQLAECLGKQVCRSLGPVYQLCVSYYTCKRCHLGRGAWRFDSWQSVWEDTMTGADWAARAAPADLSAFRGWKQVCPQGTAERCMLCCMRAPLGQCFCWLFLGGISWWCAVLSGCTLLLSWSEHVRLC